MKDSSTDALVANNVNFVEEFEGAAMPPQPSRRVAVVACMDARMDIHKILGLSNGDAHIIRNAGGVITDDVERSLCISQKYLETTEVILMHHTKCGVQTISEADFRQSIFEETGQRPSWTTNTFANVEADVTESINRLQNSPFLKHNQNIRGFVYDVDSGALKEVAS